MLNILAQADFSQSVLSSSCTHSRDVSSAQIFHFTLQCVYAPSPVRGLWVSEASPGLPSSGRLKHRSSCLEGPRAHRICSHPSAFVFFPWRGVLPSLCSLYGCMSFRVSRETSVLKETFFLTLLKNRICFILFRPMAICSNVVLNTVEHGCTSISGPQSSFLAS